MAQVSVETISAQEVAKINETSEKYIEFLLAKDVDKLVRLYTDDAVFMPPGHPAVRGRTDLKAWVENFPKVTKFDLRIEEVEGVGNLCYVRGTFSMSMRPESGPPVDDFGKYVEVRKKQPDGNWLIAVDIFNSDKS